MLLLLQKALGFGLLGLLIECIFTGIKSWIRKDVNGTCTTYLVMVPVYSTAGLLLELIKIKLLWPALVLAPIYMIVIYGCEFVWGYFYAVVLDRCPWHYEEGKWTILGYINLRYWVFWLIVGLMFNGVSSVLHVLVKILNV